MSDANDRRREGQPAMTPTYAVYPSQPLRALHEIAGEAFDRMDARAEGREQPIETPWPDLNEQLPGGGYWPGCHLLVGGTAAGKSSLSLDIALKAANDGAAVAYVTLELEPGQIVLRCASGPAGVGWSPMYNGQATAEQRARVHATLPYLESLDFYVESGNASGWKAQRIRELASAVRSRHPQSRLLVVVDFLQLIDSEEGQRQEIRERIGRAAYLARDVAQEFNAVVLLVSSVARENYARVSGSEALTSAGLDATLHDDVVLERFLRTPHTIVGLGKESGEIEYSADSVTVAVTLPKEKGEAFKQVVLATAKLRAGPAGWCSLQFDGQRFSADPTHGAKVVSLLRQAAKSKAKQKTNGASYTPIAVFDDD